MKKVGIVDYDFSVRGGVEQVSVSLAGALAEHYEVHLISLCMGGEPAYALDDRVKFTSLLGPEYRLRDMRRDLKKPLRYYLNDNDIDVALIMGNYPGFLTSTARFGTKTKLVFCDHGALMNQWERKAHQLAAMPSGSYPDRAEPGGLSPQISFEKEQGALHYQLDRFGTASFRHLSSRFQTNLIGRAVWKGKGLRSAGQGLCLRRPKASRLASGFVW